MGGHPIHGQVCALKLMLPAHNRLVTPHPFAKVYQKASHLCWGILCNRYLRIGTGWAMIVLSGKGGMQHALVSRRDDTKVSTIPSSNCSSPNLLF